MRADDDDLRATPRDFCFDIVARLSLHLIAVSSGPQTRSRKRTFDEIGSGIELCVMPHVAFANFSCELLYVRSELFAQRDFIRRQQARLGSILSRHSHSKPPE